MEKQNTKNPEQDQVLKELRAAVLELQEQITEMAKNEAGLPNLYLKMIAIMAAVSYIQKDKENKFHGYKYASEEAIKKHIQKELVNNKVLFLVTDTIVIKCEERENEKGKKAYLTTLRVKYKFVDADSGAQITGCYDGEGHDNLDKGIYKALTGALKYILTSNFLIPTGADPEDDSGEKADEKTAPQTNAPAAPPQQTTVKRTMTSKQVDDVIKDKIPGADEKHLVAVEAWMGAFKISGAHTTKLKKAIAARRAEIAKETPAETPKEPETAPAEKPFMTDKQAKDVIEKKVPAGSEANMKEVEAWMKKFRISNVNKWGLERAIAMRRSQLDGTPLPEKYKTEQQKSETK